MRASGVSCGTAWYQSFSYDQFGNISKSGTSSFLATYSGTNRVQNLGFTYDGVGNVTNDGSTSYGYNAQNLPVTWGSYQIVYDAFNRAVDIQGAPMGTWTEVVYGPDGYKFAKMRAQTVSRYFAPLGQTQDTASGLYDFLYRKQSSVHGRWLIPDPAGTAAVDITNPQTWNRYAYLANNPLNKVDAKGLYDEEEGPDLGWVGVFFGGGFSGIWGQNDLNDWETRQTFGNQYYDLPNGTIQGHEAAEAAFGQQLSIQASIDAATNLALSVLSGNNPCSSFFNDAAATFTEGSNPSASSIFNAVNIVPNYNSTFDGNMAYTGEGAGVFSTIQVQANSPWSISQSPGGKCCYVQGPFLSTSLQGHTINLFHEFGHDINALPPDPGNNELSHANTQTVSTNCASTVKQAAH